MNFPPGHAHSAPLEVLDWVEARRLAPQACSISLCTHRALVLDDLGVQLAAYLNEFDPDSTGSWRTFDCQDIRQIAGDPQLRKAVHEAAGSFVAIDSEANDYDQTAAALGALGNAILEGEACLAATATDPHVFKICLDCHGSGPTEKRACDLWINAPRFNPKSHITSIGDSFLDWRSRRPS